MYVSEFNLILRSLPESFQNSRAQAIWDQRSKFRALKFIINVFISVIPQTLKLQANNWTTGIRFPAETGIFFFFRTLYVPYLYSAYSQDTCTFT
jgi:hypothetical protein